MYKGRKAIIITEIEGEYFDIKKGVKQGDPLSPALFNCALEEVLKKMEWEQKGLNINGKRFTNLRFAIDVVLIANSREELKGMIEELNYWEEEAGLIINIKKTKILSKYQEQEKMEIQKWKTNRNSRTNNIFSSSNSNEKTNEKGDKFTNSKNLPKILGTKKYLQGTIQPTAKKRNF